MRSLQQKCSAANVKPPGNPNDIVALVAVGVGHLEASLSSAAHILSLTTHFNDAGARPELFANESTGFGKLRAKLVTAVASEALAQASKVETMGKPVRAETRLVTLYRDFELRGTRCTFLANKAAPLLAEVQRLGRQLGSARSPVARLQGPLPSLIAAVGKAVLNTFE